MITADSTQPLVLVPLASAFYGAISSTRTPVFEWPCPSLPWPHTGGAAAAAAIKFFYTQKKDAENLAKRAQEANLNSLTKGTTNPMMKTLSGLRGSPVSMSL
jgi:hypothetical protein